MSLYREHFEYLSEVANLNNYWMNPNGDLIKVEDHIQYILDKVIPRFPYREDYFEEVYEAAYKLHYVQVVVNPYNERMIFNYGYHAPSNKQMRELTNFAIENNYKLHDAKKRIDLELFECLNEDKRDAYSWQSPSGRFIPVKSTHAQDAWEIGGKQPNTDYIMNRWKAGWNRIHYAGDSLYCHNEVMPPNERQKRKLIDLAQEIGVNEIVYDGGEDSKIIWSIYDVLEGLNEGVISLHPDEYKIVMRYIDGMRKNVNKVIDKKGYILKSDVYRVCNTISNKISKNKFQFSIVYGRCTLNNTAGWYMQNSNTIGIDVMKFCKWKEDFRHGEEANTCISIDFDKVAETLIHEITHHIQSETRKEKSGEYQLPQDWNAPKKYYKRGWEQQAHAMQYLEQLKYKFNIKTPVELLKHLKLTGLIHNTNLQNLKKTDYKAWKAVMKQAILGAISNIVDK